MRISGKGLLGQNIHAVNKLILRRSSESEQENLPKNQNDFQFIEFCIHVVCDVLFLWNNVNVHMNRDIPYSGTSMPSPQSE